MKLYATVRSERASKGQGGKELHIQVRGEDKNLLLELYIKPTEGGYTADLWRQGAGQTFFLPKGEKQKGETVAHSSKLAKVNECECAECSYERENS